MYLKLALNNIRRSPFQAVSAILVLVVTFFVATLLAVVVYSSAQVLNYFETRPQVIAFLKKDAKQTDIDSLQLKLQKDDRVKDVKFVSKEDALSIYKNVTSENPLLGELVSPSVFPSDIEFSVKDLNNAKSIIDEVKKESVVDSVSFTASIGSESNMKDIVDRLSKIILYIRIGGLVVISVLGITSFLVLMVIISMRVVSKKSEIETLRLMGATSSFIGGPILLEALIYVFGGVILGWICALVVLLYATPTIINYFGVIPVLPRQAAGFFELTLIMLLVEILIGFLIAVLAETVAVSRATSK